MFDSIPEDIWSQVIGSYLSQRDVDNFYSVNKFLYESYILSKRCKDYFRNQHIRKERHASVYFTYFVNNSLDQESPLFIRNMVRKGYEQGMFSGITRGDIVQMIVFNEIYSDTFCYYFDGEEFITDFTAKLKFQYINEFPVNYWEISELVWKREDQLVAAAKCMMRMNSIEEDTDEETDEETEEETKDTEEEREQREEICNSLKDRIRMSIIRSLSLNLSFYQLDKKIVKERIFFDRNSRYVSVPSDLEGKIPIIHGANPTPEDFDTNPIMSKDILRVTFEDKLGEVHNIIFFYESFCRIDVLSILLSIYNFPASAIIMDYLNPTPEEIYDYFSHCLRKTMKVKTVKSIDSLNRMQQVEQSNFSFANVLIERFRDVDTLICMCYCTEDKRGVVLIDFNRTDNR